MKILFCVLYDSHYFDDVLMTFVANGLDDSIVLDGEHLGQTIFKNISLFSDFQQELTGGKNTYCKIIINFPAPDFKLEYLKDDIKENMPELLEKQMIRFFEVEGKE